MINHRGPEFKEILYRVTDRLKQVFDTSGDVYILTASGTGAMEAAVVNTLSPGDKVVCVAHRLLRRQVWGGRRDIRR